MQTVVLPRTFNTASMYGLSSQIINLNGEPKSRAVVFDFKALVFIEPVGVVVLSNLVEYLKTKNTICSFTGLGLTKPVVYLDDSGFFERYSGRSIRDHAAVRVGTLPLT